MKLIRQVALHFREGTSDKVYEVDLCEVGAGQYVVNFRYGRRGTALRDGTKTPAPVSLAQAETIFQKLVASKTSKGYRDTAGGAAVPQPAAAVAEGPPAGKRVLDDRARAVLQRITDGLASGSRYKLSRAIWRAGELRLAEAETRLHKLVGQGDRFVEYSIAWALGRLGGAASVDVLRRIQSDKQRPYVVRRIAAVSLLELFDDDRKAAAIEQYQQQLPGELSRLSKEGPADEFQAALEEHLDGGDHRTFAVLDVLCFINNEHVRPALLSVVRNCPLKPNYFQRLRHIFKAAELRGDGEVFGWLAYRFETERGNVNSKTYGFSWEWVRTGLRYERKSKPNALTGPDAQTAFSHATRHYLRQRVWRTLKRLGEIGQAEDYVRLATGVLLAISDDDGEPPFDSFRYEYVNRRYERTAIRFEALSRFWAVSHILYGGSRRFRFECNQRRLACYRPASSADSAPTEREEAFGHLWEQQPRALLHLLDDSCCRQVHEFAVKALRSCREFCRQLDIAALLMLLRSAYEVTVELGFELAVSRYDPTHPDRDLVLALAGCNYQRGREQAHKWIDLQRSFFLEDTSFAAELAASAHEDTRLYARRSLKLINYSQADAQTVIARLISLMQPWGEGDAQRAGDVCRTMMEVFGQQLRRIGAEVIRDLLAHPLVEVQQFAGDLLLNHETLSSRPPEDVLRGLLAADHEAVRAIGVRIISQLPDDVLLRSIDLLVGLVRHQRADIRENIRPTVLRLASTDASFGRQFAGRLVDALLVPGAPEGAPTYTANLLRDDLRGYLDQVPSTTVWKLLQSRSQPAQEIGGVLLASNIDASALAVPEIVRLASHDVRSVREAAWTMFSDQIPRMKSEIVESVRILDGAWEDSRQFAFGYFRDHFTADDLPTAVLVSICDSVREDVQQFGRELITRFFSETDGPEYLQKLSEHPAVSMQLFTSNYLDRYASNGRERLVELEPYFRSTLSRVNQGRISKDRVYRLFERELEKSPEHAQAVAGVLARQSATMAIGDKGRAIELMVRIRKLYPYIELPIELVPPEVRGGV